MTRPLIFGAYPGGAAGADNGLLTGPPDDPARIHGSLDALQGESRPFVVRCYDSFQDPGSRFESRPANPIDYAQYARPGRRPLDLVLQFRSASGDVTGYLNFVRTLIERHHRSLYSVQITEEANFASGPDVIDGPYPEVRRALVEGVVAAKDALLALGRPEVLVGFNSTPTFGPAAEFWSSLLDRHPRFLACLDYVGLDFFPDVFRPAHDIEEVVTGVLETMRAEWLTTNGFPESIPIHITEHGWPTNAGRSQERQAEVLEAAVRTAYAAADSLNIGRYTLFSLRDVAHATPENADNLFTFFGVMTADYRPKPAFERLRALIAELGAR
jgi:hypothetical protein